MTFVRPEPGVYVSKYSPATFPPCPDHPFAEAIVVFVATETDAEMHTPVCAQCGPRPRRMVRRLSDAFGILIYVT